MAAGSADRRKAKRYRHREKVRFWWGDEVEGTGFTHDVSQTGMLIETNKKLEIGSRLHVEILLEKESFFLEVVVARLKKYPRHARQMFKQGFGVRFVNLTETVKEVVAKDSKDKKKAETKTEARSGPSEAKVLTVTMDKLPVKEPELPEHIPMEVFLTEIDALEYAYEKDIKHGGLMVSTTEIPEIYSDVVVPVHLPEPNPTIECRGMVVKTFEDPPGIAVRLSEVDQVRSYIIEILRSK